MTTPSQVRFLISRSSGVRLVDRDAVWRPNWKAALTVNPWTAQASEGFCVPWRYWPHRRRKCTEIYIRRQLNLRGLCTKVASCKFVESQKLTVL
jgi:hypothetical protein